MLVARVVLSALCFIMSQGDYGEAEPLVVRALVTLEKTLGCEHPMVAETMVNQAMIFEEQVRAVRIAEIPLAYRQNV